MARSFNVRKAAQVAAYFVRAAGGSINVLKLTKLIYLADRRFMELYDCSILNDRLVSMDHGPVNSMTLNYISGGKEDPENWSRYLTDRAEYDVGLRTPMADDDFGELSDAEIGALDETWQRFGKMTKYQIRDYTHKWCPEWEDPDGSSNPIPYERVFKFLGKQESKALAERVDREQALDAIMRG